MDTLKKVRREERIVELTREVLASPDTAYLSVELRDRNGSVLVVMNHSDEIVDEVLKKLEDPADSGYIFFASELEVDPLNSCMVPLHRMATKDEIDSLLHMKVPLDRLPILRMLDPIRRWHNFPKGSIVAIERLAGTEGSNVYFRRVV